MKKKHLSSKSSSTRLIISTIISLILVVAMSFSAFAIEPGQTVASVTAGTVKPWLFLDSKTAAHNGTYTNDQMAKIGTNLRNLKTELESVGIKFMVVIAPDKDEVYPEYLPAGYKTQQIGRAGQLTAYMNANFADVPFIFPADTLLAVKNKTRSAATAKIPTGSTVPLYFESDTHWGPYGAYVASYPILEKAASLCGKSMSITPRTFRAGGVIPGDLQALCSDARAEYYSSQHAPSVPFAYNQLSSVINKKNEDVVLSKNISTKANAADIKLFFTGDSFRMPMTEAIAESVKSSTILNRYYFNTEMLLEDKPDILIYMVCERYIDELGMIPGYNTTSLAMPK